MTQVGRPSTYPGDEIIQQTVEDYLGSCGREQTKLPKATEFYRRLGISAQCADEWKDKYPIFAEACQTIHELQQEELIDDGLFGGKEVNPGMAIFLLKANHGMVETEKLKVEGNYNIDLDGIINGSRPTTQTADSFADLTQPTN